jgi:hypothetical protein
VLSEFKEPVICGRQAAGREAHLFRFPHHLLRQALNATPARDKRSRWSITVLALVVSAGAAAGVVWATSADAGPSTEPAAFARKSTLKVSHVRTLTGLGSSDSALVEGDFVPGRAPGQPQGKRVHLGGGDELIAALTGSLVPVAVQSNDQSLVAYSAWHQIAEIKPDQPGQGLQVGDPVGVPSVRIYDSTTGRDRLVATGAYSPALSSNGDLAFVKGDANVVRQNVEYAGQVVVGATRNGSFAQWTTDAARYFPYAWAGGSLLVYKGLQDSEATDLYAFTGPGQSHLVAPEATVIALSPDGTRVLVTVSRRMVEVVRVADGAVESSLALDGPGVATPDSNSTPHALMYSGSWFADRVVANSDAGLVVLNVKGGLRLESVFKTPFVHGLVEPTFTDATHVVGWADLTPVSVGKYAEPAYDHALASCDLVGASCTTGPSQPARAWTRWINNPSR